MDVKTIKVILEPLGFRPYIQNIVQFCSEEDGKPYQVWKLETEDGSFVLKQTSREEKAVYEAFLSDGGYAPKTYGFSEHGNEIYMLMEYVPGESMSKCTRPRLKRTLDALIAGQRRYWQNTSLADVGYGYARSFPNRCKRLAYMGELSESYEAYLEAFAAVPRTLCNDDMLPSNVIAGEDRAVILDWEFAGILPYPCAIARLLAFGEDDTDTLFQMTRSDKEFALDYYYENLIKDEGISREEYDRTMKLFFFKEYSEWIYCANAGGDCESENYKKYAPMAKELHRMLRETHSI